MKQKNFVVCPVCKAPMCLESGKYGLYYRCINYPKCKETHGAHPDGSPMGFPANKETRMSRIKIHKEMSKIWNYYNGKERKEMYKWLKLNTKYGHVSMMNNQEIEKALIKIKRMQQKQLNKDLST